MTPYLIAVRGPMRGMSFPLSEGEVSVGRGDGNDICLKDVLASRRHCLIRGNSVHSTIVDLGSQNGTYLNGLPIREGELKTGDRIEIGSSVFLFGLDKQRPVEQTTGPDQLLTTVAGYGSSDYPDLPLPMLLKVSGIMDCIRALYTAVHDRDQQAYERLLLTLIFDLVPAERGAVIQKRHRTEKLNSASGWDRRSGEQNITVAPATIEHVMKEGVPSLISGPAGSVLCVPLASGQDVIGAIYLAASLNSLTEQDSQVMVAVARIAALAVENAQQMEWLEWQNRRLEDSVESQHGMLGKSACMKDVYEFVARVAPTDSTVLIHGESGTGKELVARAIHANSRRSAKPFITLNCAALPETLVESELFGYEKGAFTGAIGTKKGILEMADRGTVFLDEIGELPITQQAKLLRAIERHEFIRVGSSLTTEVDVRIIAATNRNLQKAINDGTFRSDLYFRINVVSLKLPPLRDRRDDIPMLSSFFLQHFTTKYNAEPKSISRRAQSALLSYDWPGNVRELQNAIERAVVLSTSNEIQPEDLPESALEAETTEQGLADFHSALREKKKDLIIKALTDAHGSFTQAARILGVHPNYLHRLVTNLGLRGQVRGQNS